MDTLAMWALYQMYVLMAMTGLGYLALTWSTVVLLGGFVTLLPRKDFWCLTVISMLQAARIFNDLGDQLIPTFFNLLVQFQKFIADTFRSYKFYRDMLVNVLSLLLLPPLAVGYIVVFLYGYGRPTACVGLALWRISQRDYGSNNQDPNKTNLVPALDMFYSIILCQGVLYAVWLLLNLFEVFLVVRLRQSYELPGQWGSTTLLEYMSDTRAKGWRDPASIRDREFQHYAAELVESVQPGSREENRSGARIFAALIRHDWLGQKDVGPCLLPSRLRVQKLIDMLAWRDVTDKKTREDAAFILEHLARGIQLAQLPGAIHCISTLLQDDATMKDYYSRRPESLDHSNSTSSGYKIRQTLIRLIDKSAADEDDDQDRAEGAGCNQLILQGLTILEELAWDHQNCIDICSAPDVLPKLMAPLNSVTLIQDIRNNQWADVVNKSFSVLSLLVRAPGESSARLRHDTSTNTQALANLENIIDQRDGARQELQIRAMEILAELAKDLKVNLSREVKEKLIKKLLQTFHDQSRYDRLEASAAAGRTLAVLSTNSMTYSTLIMEVYGGTVDCLYKMLDAMNTSRYRTIAARISENLCTHCALDREHVTEALLPKVLAGIKLDLEPKSITSTKERQGAFLSLALVIYDKQVSAEDFNNAVQRVGLGNGAFVMKLKAMVEENQEATMVSLRIVKCCSQIAVSMMRRRQYHEYFRNQGFMESLSKAKEILCNLESCMLFAGSELDGDGLKKITRPLLCDLEKEVQGFVNENSIVTTV